MTNTEKLIQVLQLLAAPTEVQVRSFPSYVVVADEIALLFDDEMIRLRSAGAFEALPSGVRSVLAAIDARLEAMGTGKEGWTLEARRSSDAWDRVREQARSALEALGETPGTPKIDWVTYARG